MKKQIDISTEAGPSFSERLNDHPILSWISENTKNFTYLLLIIVAVGVLAYRSLSYFSSKTGYNYVVAESDYTRLEGQTGEEFAGTAKQLLEILDRQPDLQAIYDGKLAQLLLVQGDVKNAELLVNRALSRTSEENRPLFTRYVETTLLIAKEDYPKALKQAIELNEYILENPELATPILLPANLLRIATLEQKLGMNQEENLTWEKWKEYASGDVGDSSLTTGFQKVASVFQERKFGLNNYIELREKDLK